MRIDLWILTRRIGAAIFLALLALRAFGAPTLDTAFGTNGTAIQHLPIDSGVVSGESGYVRSLAAMRNGAIFSEGAYITRFNLAHPVYVLAMVQFTGSGSPSDTFGNHGVVFPRISALEAQPFLLMSDQIIYLSGGNLALIDAKGVPVPEFVTDGAASLDWFLTSTWYKFAQQADGKIILGGNTGGSLAMVRFNPDGTLDKTFNQTGGVIVPLGANADVEPFTGLAIQSDGKIVIAGASQLRTSSDLYYQGIALARYSSSGTPDASFGTDGRTTITASNALGPYGNYSSSSLVIQPTGRLVVCGQLGLAATQSGKSVLLGIASNGAIDGTFGIGGLATLPSGGDATTGPCVVQPDGKLLASLSTSQVVRTNANGSMDASFGTGGILTLPPYFPSANDIALQADGNMLVGGAMVDPGVSSVYAVQRYLSGPMAAIEFYNVAMDHYFMSMNPQEVAVLDLGVFAGWARTGLSFLTYGSLASASGTSANPVCRFYIPPQHGDSHFFSADPVECEVVRGKINTDPSFSGYIEETPNAFYIDLPNRVSGDCSPNTTPVYRLWNQRFDSNHRYTTSLAAKNQMISRGWVAEGFGPNGVDMCAPQ